VVSTPNGTMSDALVAADLAHIIWGVNLGCIGFHVWPFHADTPEITDELRVDLDPSPGVGFPQLQHAAVLTREMLDELGIEAYVKTSGSRGLHIYVGLQPRWNGYEVRAAAVALARALQRRHPGLITAQWWKEERGSRVFVDFNQNAPHKTVFGAWCVRPRVGAQVSTPIGWDELATVEPDGLTIATVPARVAERGDPWAGMAERPQSLEPLLELSRHDLAHGLMDAPWPPVYPKQPNEPPRVAPSRARRT
jgi:DNA ligase D-like protein (predicted polymerase)